MKNSKAIGNLTELQCITGLYELGCDVSIPFGNSQKYDLIIDWNNKLYKVQVKHANEHYEERINELGELITLVTHITFETRWQGHNCTGYSHTPYTKEDIDFFATWYNGQTYLIPITECSKTEKTLRFFPPKNGQIKGVSFANNYLAKEVLNQL